MNKKSTHFGDKFSYKPLILEALYFIDAQLQKEDND